MSRLVAAADVPCLARLVYWGEDPEVAVHDSSDVLVVASAAAGFIVLLGAEEREVFLLTDDADLIYSEFD